MQNRARSGLLVVEAVIAMAVLLLVAGAAVMMVRASMNAAVSARKKYSAQETNQLIMARLKNIDFFYLFDVDSSSANYGLSGNYNVLNSTGGFYLPTKSVYPYLGVLDDINKTVLANGYDRFTLKITYLRKNSDTLSAFVDNVGSPPSPTPTGTCKSPGPGNGIDDSDEINKLIRFNDLNGDHDCNDIYLINNQWQSEVPSTHMRQVTVTLYKNGKVVKTEAQSQVFALGEGTSLDESLTLTIIRPAIGACVYQDPNNTITNINTYNPVYPKGMEPTLYPNDHSFVIAGQGPPPGASVSVNFKTSTVTVTVGTTGYFLATITNFSFDEGNNLLKFWATIGNQYSPIVTRNVIFDKHAPIITNTFANRSNGVLKIRRSR